VKKSSSVLSTKPELLIIGDSHARALKDGADALGLKSFLVAISGNVWHTGLVVAHPHRGMVVRKLRQPNAEMGKLCEIMGIADVTRTGLPVLASIGYHLGRLVPSLSWNGHRTFQAGAKLEPDTHFMSAAFVRDYVDAARGPVFKILEKLAANGPLTVVAPPVPF
jgi:hypothetical protein